MSDNLKIWDTLGRTDPAHTKKFTRGGGFKGTAIKPIYTDQKMTETFGPCGIGWGISEPKFETFSGPDGQMAVYCWVTIWFVKDDVRSQSIPGVGGDFIIKKFSSGLTMDDEAFKKAYTDAIGNAMKHLGMSADVHMGLFDDSKYVASVEREFRNEQQPPRQSDRHINEDAGQDDGPSGDDLAQQFIAECERRIGEFKDAIALKTWWASPAFVQQCEHFNLTGEEVGALKSKMIARGTALTTRIAA